MGDFKACLHYANHLLDACWSHSMQMGWVSLLFIPELKHINWQVGGC